MHFISGVPPYEGAVSSWRLVGAARRDAMWHFGAMLDIPRSGGHLPNTLRFDSMPR